MKLVAGARRRPHVKTDHLDGSVNAIMARASTASTAPAGEKALRLRQRQKLIDACISALYVHGPSRTTIDKVVAIAEMSPGIVNFYFETKAALLLAALEHLAQEFEEHLLVPLAALVDTPVLALERLISLYLDTEIASARKVSVWYAFWGEASSRREYYNICGKRDLAFANLVRNLTARLVGQYGPAHLNADAIALGLIGTLEMMWQDIAFHEEADLDRAAARARCMDYLRSIFPNQFGTPPTAQPATADDVQQAKASAAPPAAGLNGSAMLDGLAMLLMGELALAGVPAVRPPAAWPGCHVIAQPAGATPQRLHLLPLDSATQATFMFSPEPQFDWLVLASSQGITLRQRRFYLLPRAIVESHATPAGANRLALHITAALHAFSAYENNFALVAAKQKVK